MNKFYLRKAVPDDATAVCGIQRSTWLETYVSPENGITYDDIDEYTSSWTSKGNIESFRKFILESENLAVWIVAVRPDGAVLGHVRATKEPSSVSIDMLYVLPGEQSAGIGSSLLNEVERLYGESEYVVDVVSYNSLAINFYERRGYSFLRDESNNAKPLPSGVSLPLKRFRKSHSGICGRAN